MSGGVRKLASVVVGAVVGFAQGGPWGAVAGAALAFYASEQQEKLNTKSPLRDNEPSAQTVRSSKAPVRFILGRVSTGGVLVWAQEQAGAQGEGEWLHLVYVLCEGPIAALENIYLGEEEIGSYGAQATYELVVNPTQVNAFLKANCPDWKDSQIGRGLSFVRVSLQYSAEKFPSGIPDTRFVVRGRNDVYDPRTGTAVYSANTALHLLWFLRARCGVPDDEIVFETFASAANVCDEALTNADGSTSQRYRSGCVIGADEQRTGVLQKLEAACGGHLIRVGGRWMLQAGAYYGPYDFEITEDMVIGTVTGSTEPTNDSAINTVRGTFIDPSQSWTETDYPEVSVAEWIVEDGGEAAETLTYSYVTDPYQAQRLANMELRRRRAGGAISIPMNFAGYNCRPGRVVRVNLPSLNILGEFIVSDWSMGDSEGCTVQVKQYEAAIFDDAVGQPYNPIGFINLPAGGLGTPSAVTWTQDTTAEVTQGVLSWLPPTGIVKEYIVIVRQGATAVQSHNVPATSTEISINGLPSGNYTMSVAAVGPMARSGEATITVSINGPPIPESCVVQSSIDSIVLIPSNSQNGLNGGTYEYFFSTSPTATAADAEYLGQGLTFTHNGLGFWTNYYYFIRSSNAYGKSSFLYVPAQTSNDVSAYLAALAGKIGRTELGQDIVDEIDKIPGLQDQIDALDGLKGYNPDDTYEEYDLVVQGKRIYQATGPVPINTPPPNSLYWLDVGQTVETASGLAQQVATNTAEIIELDGEVTAQATAFQALRASFRDDNGEGELADALKGWSSTAAIATEEKVRASENLASAQKLTTLDSKVDENEANVTELRQTVATDKEATAQAITQVNVKVGENTAAIQETSTAYADTSGKLSTMWSVKMQVTANGQYVAAGIGLGIENTGAGLQSQFLVSADRFAIVNTIAGGAISVPFAVQGGQVFMNSAFIQDGSITMLKIGQYLQSDNYIPGTLGWRLDKAGNLEFNGPAPGGGRLTMTNRAIKVFDQNGVKRVQLGDLDA
ncbi:phage tail tip fiber protein [Pseudomonas parakoreensis]